MNQVTLKIDKTVSFPELKNMPLARLYEGKRSVIVMGIYATRCYQVWDNDLNIIANLSQSQYIKLKKSGWGNHS